MHRPCEKGRWAVIGRKRIVFTALTGLLLVLLGVGIALSQPPEGAEEALTRSPNCSAVCLELPKREYRKIREDKEYVTWVNVRYLSADGTRDETFEAATIHGHGNSSWDYDKKSWTVTFDEPVGLLSCATAKKYLLISMTRDNTYLRDTISYDMARKCSDEWTQDCEHTEVFVNGEYAGLYLLVEKIDGENGALFPLDADGAFLVELEGLERKKREESEFRICHSIGLRDTDVYERLAAVERAVKAEDRRDPVSGKHRDELLDLDSIARIFIISEITQDNAINFTSSYFYCKGNGDEKLYAGPAWDYDRAYGQVFLRNDVLISLQQWRPDDARRSWYSYLYEDPAFYQRVCELYEREYLPQLEKLIGGGIEERYRQIAQAAARDEPIRGKWESLEERAAPVDDPPTDPAALQQWLSERTAFLGSCWDGSGNDAEEIPYWLITRSISNPYVSVADVGLWGWFVHHRLLLEAVAVGAAAGCVFLTLLIRDHRRCTGRG